MSAVAPETPITIAGPAGRLQARWRPVGPGAEPRAVAVLCHPHPLYGGTLHNKTLFRLAKRLATDAVVPSLRFNFRGAGESEGVHDGGRGEVDDARAAFDDAALRVPARPVVAVGFSFGAAIGLRAAVDDERVRCLVALGTPLRAPWDLEFLRIATAPRLFVQGEHDEFGPAPELETFAGRCVGEVRVHVVAGADHLFGGREDEAVEAAIEYIRAHC